MCGIAGIVNLSATSAVPVVSLLGMAQSMRHRGPDGEGLWVAPDRRMGLAHRRLSIIDLSPAGAQPMANEDGTVQVTFNGEIYNFRELRRELESRGHRFRSQSDTEVIVHLYEDEGEDFVRFLDGDFAIGLWDERNKKLVLARDPLGVKPLYYMEWQGRFHFASEMRALLRARDAVPELDPRALYDYLTFLVAPPPQTLCQGIFKLAAGSILILRPEHSHNAQVHKYWEPLPRDLGLSPSDLDATLQGLFSASVRKRLMSDVPVGVLFSGGVDSTLNAAAFAKLIAPERVRTFTVRTAGDPQSEAEGTFARDMARRLGTEHHEVEIVEQDLLDQAMELAYRQDEPISDPVTLPLHFVTRLARQTGTTVVHAGEGADEIFCGYDSYRRFMRQHSRLWRPLSRLPNLFPAIGFQLLRLSGKPLHHKIADVLRRSAKGQEFFMSAAVAYYEDEKQSIITPAFRRSIEDYDSFAVVEPFYRRINDVLPSASILQKITFIELQLRLPELLLMRADKMSMANSVELRVPFLDRKLVEFAISAPESFILRDGVSKEPLKRMAAQSVPRETVYKPKVGFGAPIQSWFHNRLGDEMRSLLNEERQNLEPWLNLRAIDRRLNDKPRTVNQAFQLWVIFNLCNWQRSLRSAIETTAAREARMQLRAEAG